MIKRKAVCFQAAFFPAEESMNDFIFHTPTKVVFGRESESKLGSLLREQGCRKVLIHYGGGSAERSGLLGRVREVLKAEGIAWVELGGVVPNPRLSLVYEGIELGRREGVDFILAVGGGSVIDSAKAIGYGIGSGGDVWELFERKRKVTACTPIGVILTIAATGSEMSSSCVITAEDGWRKLGCTSETSRPRFAIMDPTLTMTLPDYQTACGCVDILMHTMERWFYASGGMELTDRISASLMRTVMKHALILRDDPQNYESRAEVLWAGALSHNGLTGCGSDGGIAFHGRTACQAERKRCAAGRSFAPRRIGHVPSRQRGDYHRSQNAFRILFDWGRGGGDHQLRQTRRQTSDCCGNDLRANFGERCRRAGFCPCLQRQYGDFSLSALQNEMC